MKLNMCPPFLTDSTRTWRTQATTKYIHFLSDFDIEYWSTFNSQKPKNYYHFCIKDLKKKKKRVTGCGRRSWISLSASWLSPIEPVLHPVKELHQNRSTTITYMHIYVHVKLSVVIYIIYASWTVYPPSLYSERWKLIGSRRRSRKLARWLWWMIKAKLS